MAIQLLLISYMTVLIITYLKKLITTYLINLITSYDDFNRNISRDFNHIFRITTYKKFTPFKYDILCIIAK